MWSAPFGVLFALVLVGCSAPTRHWTPFEPPRPEKHGSFEFLLRYDSNNDGKITRAELEAGLRQDFRQADTNHDGRLDPDEVLAVNQRRIKIDQSIAIPLIDWNHDGYVDFAEFAAPMRSLFEQYDADEDGVVTLQEMHVRLEHVPPQKPATGDAPGGSH
jgi:Ca2+-binding EF-hand superfamily protein